MTPEVEAFTIGVEEEHQLVDSTTRELRPRAARVLPAAEATLGEAVQPELYGSQIETVTPVCRSLAEARAEIVRLRRGVIAAAELANTRLASAGTHPFSRWDEQQITPKDRYRGIAENYQQLARELVIFGCHVHVGISDREAAIQVMNRARVWLGPLLALSANSPFWLGMDTGYASFRTELWGRFPLAGPPGLFSSRAEYDALINALVSTGAIEDGTNIYWDVRPSARYETLEFRVTDVCLTVDEAVMVAGLVRGLVRTCHSQALRDQPYPAARGELLRVAHWQAARFGLEADLIDVGAASAVPARSLIDSLLSFVREALEDSGDWDEVSGLVATTFQRGTGAARQRAAYRRAGRWEDVVDLVVSETAIGLTT